jgi:hypothetical protein
MSDKKIVYISPSRWSTRGRCARLGFLAYEHMGNGLSTVARGPLYFDIGHACHDAARSLWEGGSLAEAMALVPTHFPDAADLDSDLDRLYRQESLDIATALVYVWGTTRLPSLLSEYEPIMLETPAEFSIYEDDLIDIRIYTILDGLLRRRSDDRLVSWEMKTIKEATYKWVQGWGHDTQVAIELLAAEQLAQRVGTDSPVSGVMIDALLKGSVRSYKDGIKRHSNSLVWPYRRGPVGHVSSGEWSYKYRSGSDWKRVLASQAHPDGLIGWVRGLPEEVLLSHTRTLEPVRISRDIRESLIRQLVGAMRRDQQALAGLPDEVDASYWHYVDEHFEMNTRSCIWPSPCQFFGDDGICFSPSVRADPLGSGRYAHRKTIQERQAAEAAKGD